MICLTAIVRPRTAARQFKPAGFWISVKRGAKVRKGTVEIESDWQNTAIDRRVSRAAEDSNIWRPAGLTEELQDASRYCR
jgi:hypothetical protein